MTQAETRALFRAATVLLAASVIRVAWEHRKSPPVVPPDAEDVLPNLLEETRAAVAEAERRDAPLGEGETLDPNRASEVELDRLPGVGPSVAAAVVEHRETVGGFQRSEDLLEVRGIGPATLKRIAPLLDFDRPPPVVGVARRSPGGEGGKGGEPGERGGVGEPAPLDLNRATGKELEGLPGVGPALAGRILELRRERGRFRRVEDLLDVRGIGPATLERIRPRVQIGIF